MRTRPVLLLTAILLFAFFFLAYPVYVIRPFRYQGPRELAAALLVTQYRPYLEILLSAAALFLLITAWRRVTAWRKSMLVLLTLLVLACELLSRVNVYEKMFHPLEQPAFSAAAQSKLDADEQVIAVKVNNAARAYPIRGISYHHIVNDTLGGRAIVATY
jgi:hypothetical protein